MNIRFFREWHHTWVKGDRVRAWLLGVAIPVMLVSGALSAPNFDRILELALQRGAEPAAQRYRSWRSLVQTGTEGSEVDRLTRVNDFFNRQILFDDDSAIWGQADYWATLSDTLGAGRADCEDFVIAKYFTLRQLGLARERLRLVYVRARNGTGNLVPARAHMVLAYYAQPDAEPLILDNLIGEIRLASRRPDLTPVFSFDQEGLFTGAPGSAEVKIGGIGRLSRWEDLLKRARLEGFD